MATRVVAFEIEAGTNGCSIAQAVATRLGCAYHEEDILVRAARLAGVSDEAMTEVQRVPSFFLRLGEVLETSLGNEFQFSSQGTLAAGGGWLMAPRNRSFLEHTIRQLAASGSCVMVGHGLPVVLKDSCPRPFAVLARGSFGWRAANYAGNHELSLAEAEDFIRDADQQTATYLKHAYRVDGRDAHLYDLSICLDHLDDATAVELIVASVQSSGTTLERRSQSRRGS